MITVLSVGKKHEEWVLEGIERYQKRLRAPFNIEWVLLPHSSLDGVQARQEESERLLKRIDDRAYMILLDERGKAIDSPAFASLLERQFQHTGDVIIVIGGAYGVDETVSTRANVTVSLSSMVFPHQLVRLILIEQIYRAQEIAGGGKYHHE